MRVKKGSYLGKDVVIAFALDITDIKTAQEAIKKERDQVQKYLDIAGVMLGVLDRNGTITLMNKKGFEILEYSEEELIGKNWFDNCLPKEIIPEIKNFFNETMKGDQKNIEYYDNPILTKHGKTKLIAFHNTVLTNNNLEIIGVLFSGEDITEKDLAKKKLEKSEFNLKEAQRIAKIGHWELDIPNNILYWSDEVYRIFNLDKHNFEATYESFLNFIHPEDREYVNNRYNDSIKNHTPYNITHRIKLKNGTIKYVREIGKTFYDKNKAVRSIGTVQDITDRVLAEQKLNSQLKRNQLILNTTNDGFILADDKGNIFETNPAYCKLIGYSSQELKKMNIRDLEIPIPKEQIDSRINRMLKQGYDNFETQHITKHGKKIDLSVSIAITKYENKPFIAAFVRDITLQKQSLENLKKSREEISELAQHLQDIREEERRSIATEIHDDLGQSLTALKLDTTILLKLLSSSDKAITKKIESMKDLADQTIRTVQKISSELRPGILDDLGLAAAIEWEASKFQERTNIKCTLTLEPSDISLSENLNVTIFRLFQETCTNVARHSKATELDINITKQKYKLIMKIKDNGIGITASQINDHKSFGIIGMKERLKNLNGKINFVGKPNKGTIVQIEVPLKSED